MAESHVRNGTVLFPGSHRGEGVGNADHSVGPNASPQAEDARWEWPRPIEQGGCVDWVRTGGSNEDGSLELS